MKSYKFIPAFLLMTALLSCSKEPVISVKNNLNEARADEVIVLKRAELESALKLNEKNNLLPVVKLNGKYVPTQLDDMNRDGNWDELAFIVNIGANETLNCEVECVESVKYPTFEKRTNVRLGIHQPDGTYKEYDHYTAIPATEPFEIIAQGESVSWENDKMGFRNYFDCRNVKDLFGKRKPGLIIDKIHTPEMGSYHDLADWGMDILHCGNSVGSGGLALFENDSLYRLGSTDDYEYQKITEGPVRSVFDLIYKGWHVEGQNLSAKERIAIYPGKYWFQSDVTVSGFQGEKQIATGIVTTKLKNTKPQQFDVSKDYKAIATHDVQSLNNDELGMAVVVKANEITKIGEANKDNYYFKGKQYQTVSEKEFSNVISDTYFVAQKIKNDTPARHYFSAVWGLENAKWKEMTNFKSYLKDEAKKWDSPLEVSIQ
ncbi:MAG: DUF4861 domain-containing protein [Mangrovibacterium sp.]